MFWHFVLCVFGLGFFWLVFFFFFIEWFGLEEAFKGHRAQPPRNEQGHLQFIFISFLSSFSSVASVDDIIISTS